MSQAKPAREKKNTKTTLIHILMVALSTLSAFGIGAAFGNIAKRNADLMHLLNEQVLLFVIVTIISVVVAFLLQTLIHELGHLIFGLLSGWKFVSFRVGSMILSKDADGKFSVGRFYLVGTSGQCLMEPPNYEQGDYSQAFYNLGGIILNLLTATLFLGLIFTPNLHPYAVIFFMFLALFGIVDTITNGIPVKSKMIANDGYNALSLTNDPEAKRAFWIQLKGNAYISHGSRIGNLPARWFKLPSDEELQNYMVASLAPLAVAYQLDRKNYDEAIAMIDHLLEVPNAMAGVHRNMLINDRIYLALVIEENRVKAKSLMTHELDKFRKSMKKFISVARTQYAIELLLRHDLDEAEEALEYFKHVASRHPNQGEIEGEIELVKLAKAKGDVESD